MINTGFKRSKIICFFLTSQMFKNAFSKGCLLIISTLDWMAETKLNTKHKCQDKGWLAMAVTSVTLNMGNGYISNKSHGPLHGLFFTEQ